MKIARIFIDLDGPILDVVDRYYKTYTEAIKAIGFVPVEKELYWNLKRAKTPEIDILKLSFSEKYIDKYTKIRNSLIEKKKFLECDIIWPELEDIYAELFIKIPAVLVTLRSYEARMQWQLKRLGIYSWFQRIYAKPEYSSVQEQWRIKSDVIKNSGLLKKENIKKYIFVGDTEADILAGKSLGIKTVAVSFGIREKGALLKAKPDILFETKEEFADFLKKEIL